MEKKLTVQSLKAKLWLLGAISTLGVALLAVSALWHSEQSKTALLHFVDHQIALNRAANATYGQGLQVDLALRNYMIDPSNKNVFENFSVAGSKFREEFGILNQLLSAEKEDSEISARLMNNVALLQPLQQQAFDLITSGNIPEAKNLLVTKETPAWRPVRIDLTELVKNSEKAANKERASLVGELNASQIMVILLSLLGFAFVSVTTVFVARGVFRQIGGEPADVADILRYIAKGDLTREIDVSPSDTSSIMFATSGMQTQIRDLVGTTVSNADSVVQESEAIRADADRLAKTAEEQSIATSAIAAAVEQLTASISVMSGGASDARHLSSESERQGQAGLNVVSAATDVIQQVSNDMADASATMDELSSRLTVLAELFRLFAKSPIRQIY